jgi:hypothetical protein
MFSRITFFKGLKMENIPKSELVEVITRFSLDNQDELVQEIVRDFYWSHSKDEIIQFLLNSGMSNEEIQKQLDFNKV